MTLDLWERDALSPAQRSAAREMEFDCWVEGDMLCFQNANQHVCAMDRDGVVTCEDEEDA